MADVLRKVVEWVEQPREWRPVFECGHPEYREYGYSAEEKDAVAVSGGRMRCYVCSSAQERVEHLERQLAEARAKVPGAAESAPRANVESRASAPDQSDDEPGVKS